jgi:hypothetical protein
MKIQITIETDSDSPVKTLTDLAFEILSMPDSEKFDSCVQWESQGNVISIKRDWWIENSKMF